MLYLTLKDDPFPDQEHDENALLEVTDGVAFQHAFRRPRWDLGQDSCAGLGSYACTSLHV